jgi:hypothetical protein
MGKNKKTTAELGAELREAYKAVEPLAAKLRARIRKAQAKAEGWSEEAQERGGTDFLIEWEYYWLVDCQWELYESNVIADGVMLTVPGFYGGYDEQFIPFAAIDNMDEIIGSERVDLQIELAEKRERKAAKREAKRAKLLAQVAKIDAEIAQQKAPGQ